MSFLAKCCALVQNKSSEQSHWSYNNLKSKLLLKLLCLPFSVSQLNTLIFPSQTTSVWSHCLTFSLSWLQISGSDSVQTVGCLSSLDCCSRLLAPQPTQGEDVCYYRANSSRRDKKSFPAASFFVLLQHILYLYPKGMQNKYKHVTVFQSCIVLV